MGANQHTSEGRDVPYRIRFTADEKRALEARAAAAGVSLAELIRAALGLAKAATVRVGAEPELTDRYGSPAKHLLDTVEAARVAGDAPMPFADLLETPAFKEGQHRKRRK